MKSFDRTWLAVALIVIVALIIFNPGWLLSIMGIVQSIAITTLCIVATVYLWKRL
jgi:hypothetical protein